MKKSYLKSTLLLFCLVLYSVCGYSQTGSIVGQVLDETNQPLPGASVNIQSINRGTSTDASGNFKLNVIPHGTYTLTVSFIGYQLMQKSVTVSGETRVSFKLAPNSQNLSEVVVVGYGTQRKGEVTGSISTVTSRDFQKGTISTPEQLIVGKIPGVSITSNSGAPGSGSAIRIRGGASLNASNDPLIVIDGIPITEGRKSDGSRGLAGVASPLSLLNPNDIESFTVLKDAAATAIYGSRASNGVIIITTKKGVSGKPAVNFSTNFSASKIGKTVDVFSADEYRDFVNNNPKSTAANKGLLGTASTNWQDEIFRTAFATDNNLSIAGSAQGVPYRISAGYLNQQGILLTDRMERTSAAISANPKMLDNHLKVDINIKASMTRSRFGDAGAIGAAVTFDPTQPIYDPNRPFGGYFEWMNGNGPNTQSTRNPVAWLKQKDDRGSADRSFGNIQFDYSFHFLPELHANLNLGYDVSRGYGRTIVPANSAREWATAGINNKYQQKNLNTVGEFYLNYTKDIKEINSNVNVTAGYGYYDNLTKNYNYSRYSANGDLIPNSAPVFDYDKPRNTLISYYGRLVYTLANRYTLTGTIRTDGSSRFNPDGRWGVFPSGAFTWRINEEPFLKGSSTLSDLKFRISYGETGNQEGFANYSYLPVYALSANTAEYQLGDTFYNMYRPAAYDAELEWEKTATSNIGLDYGFLNNRINGTIDVYYKKTTNLLSEIPIPAGSNFANRLLTNVGNIENRGVEFSINAVPVKTANLSWEAGFNLTYNKNKITKLTAVQDPSFVGNATGGVSGATGYNVQIQSVGYNTFSYFVYKQVYDQDGKPLEGVYADLNGDGIINQNDLYRYKSPFPKFTLGFSTQLNYKKWNVSTVLRSNIGNYMYNNVASNLSVVRNILNPLSYLQNATKDVLNTNFYTNQVLSDYYLENASFLRMDNLSLGYNAGKVWNGKANLRLSLRCQNVFTVTDYSGLDPEIFQGIDNNMYPRPRIFGLGVNVDF